MEVITRRRVAKPASREEPKQQQSNVGLDVYFVSSPRKDVSAAERKQGLLRIAKNDLPLARKLVARKRTRIARLQAPDQARAWAKRLQQAGWHVEICRGDRVCFASLGQSSAGSLRAAGASAGSVQLPAKKSSVSSVRVRRITDKRAIGSFCLPVNWVAMPQLNANASLAFGDAESELYWIAISQTKQSVGALVPLAHYAQAACEAATQWVNKGKLTAALAPIPGRSGYMARLDGTVNDTPVTYQIGVFETRKHFYCCYGWTTSDAFDQYRVLFQTLAASFRPAS